MTVNLTYIVFCLIIRSAPCNAKCVCLHSQRDRNILCRIVLGRRVDNIGRPCRHCGDLGDTCLVVVGIHDRDLLIRRFDCKRCVNAV